MLLCVALIAGGCATNVLMRPDIPDRIPATKVLLMKPDVQLSRLTAGGLHEPDAEWTEKGFGHVNSALTELLEQTGAEVIRYDSVRQESEIAHSLDQVNKLYELVGTSIVEYKFLVPQTLPSKSNRFDWTLGAESVREIREQSGADYALFVYLHDSYATSGRVGVMLIGAFFGVGVPTRRQVAFSSLVDLRSGDVVWFNWLRTPTGGTLREAEPASRAVETLMSELPIL